MNFPKKLIVSSLTVILILSCSLAFFPYYSNTVKADDYSHWYSDDWTSNIEEFYIYKRNR